MTEDFDDRLDSLEDIVRRLTGMLVAQHATNERMDAYIEAQQSMNERMATFVESQRIFNAELVDMHRDMRSVFERLDTRMERIEHLLERMLPRSTNGREDE